MCVCVCVCGGGGPDPLTALLWIRPCIEKILIILSKSNQYSMCPQSIRLDTKFFSAKKKKREHFVILTTPSIHFDMKLKIIFLLNCESQTYVAK